MPVWSRFFFLGRDTPDPISYRCRYASVVGVLPAYGGFSACSCRPHLFIQSAVTVPFFFSCSLIRRISSGIHFAVVCIMPHPPSFFVLCNVDSGTRNISPFHKNHEIVMFICLRLSFGGGRICVIYHSLANRYSCSYRILWFKSSARWIMS